MSGEKSVTKQTKINELLTELENQVDFYRGLKNRVSCTLDRLEPQEPSKTDKYK